MQLHQKSVEALATIVIGGSTFEESNLPFELQSDPDPEIEYAYYQGAIISPSHTDKELMLLLSENPNFVQRVIEIKQWNYVCEKLEALSTVEQLSEIVYQTLHPRNFLNTPYSPKACFEYLNNYLQYDQLEIYEFQLNGQNYYKARNLVEQTIEFEIKHEILADEYIKEQLVKCNSRITSEDYPGAITSARGLLEEVLKAIQTKLDPSPRDTGGDLIKLYKEVQRLLNLDPSVQPVEPLKQLLNGLTSIVNGLSSLRNKSSDSHARRFNPMSHHARLAVNSAKTLCDFLFETFEYQQKTGRIIPIETKKYA